MPPEDKLKAHPNANAVLKIVKAPVQTWCNLTEDHYLFIVVPTVY